MECWNIERSWNARSWFFESWSRFFDFFHLVFVLYCSTKFSWIYYSSRKNYISDTMHWKNRTKFGYMFFDKCFCSKKLCSKYVVNFYQNFMKCHFIKIGVRFLIFQFLLIGYMGQVFDFFILFYKIFLIFFFRS